ncbi:MAG: D-alanyl-D-alanine carboxypeptidase [Gemmobacter sp.]|jgi:D-alanyl-D-alanine carboxypeptidase (penicillin-binding protein 5/6)|nr:D-alanyl-D-alanine carboxypeptidase [Gemmobacter sp.]
MIKRLRLVLALVLLSAPAQAFETQATAAWVYDVTTRTVLLDKNADTSIPPASMSKLMTLNMLFEALQDGRYAKDTTFPVSEKAWKMGGSKMFVKPDDRPSVEDLIHGIIINSGNDACVVVAEGMGGSEDAFARRMTERAHELGMESSTFTNASGWPAPDHRMSAHDLGLLAVRMITEFPEYYPYFGLTEYSYKGRVPANSQNRNPLLRIQGGDWKADGLKTGHTEEAGYGLVGSAVHEGGRRIVFVLAGLPSERARAEESERIANWAFREFAMKTVARAGARIAEAEVWDGEVDRVGLVPVEDVSRLIPAGAHEKMTAEVVYRGPVAAPVAAGAQVAELVVHIPGIPEARVPLVAETAVPKAGLARKLIIAAQDLFHRVLSSGATAS